MWEDTMVLMLRALLNDLDSDNYTYTDARLKQMLTIGAYNVKADADFGTDYTINVTGPTISPDPVVNQDEDFVILTVYKTACIIVASEVKTQANNAIAIKDGPSSIDLRGISGQLGTVREDYCGKYSELLNRHRYENSITGSMNIGQAILGPYSPGSDFAIQYQRMFGRL
jgi:hypothetical protein